MPKELTLESSSQPWSSQRSKLLLGVYVNFLPGADVRGKDCAFGSQMWRRLLCWSFWFSAWSPAVEGGAGPEPVAAGLP